MTTVSDHGADVLQFPDLSGAEAGLKAKAQERAPVRVRAREEAPAAEVPAVTQPPPPNQHPTTAITVHRRSWRPKRPMPSGRAVAGILAGGSVVAAPAPSIMATWARHQLAAEFYRNPLVKFPRYAYGAWHAFVLVPVLYLIGWATDSPPKATVSAALAVLALWLIHSH